jgi:hypothetical protein
VLNCEAFHHQLNNSKLLAVVSLSWRGYGEERCVSFVTGKVLYIDVHHPVMNIISECVIRNMNHATLEVKSSMIVVLGMSGIAMWYLWVQLKYPT